MSELVKHYQNTMAGIPQLSNNWGSMITLLDAILVTGFNFVPVVSINRNADQATILFAQSHGFLERQVVRITGSTNAWNGDYKVFSVTSDTITILCDETLPAVAQGTIICSAAPLDFEIVFKTVDNSATPKRAYRSTAPDSLGLILLVHDFASTGASVSGAKFAKVGVVSAMMDIDTITGQQMPFNPIIPNANWEYSNTSHGWAKWYYKVSNPTNNDMSLETRDSSSPSNSISPFVISGNNLGFGLQIGITSLDFYASYGFLQFYDETIGRENIVLLAFGVNSRKTQASYILTANRCSLALSTISNPNETYTGDPTPNLKGVIWFDRNGNMNYKLLGQPFHYQHLRSSEVIASYNSSTQDIVINDAEGYSRGVLPFLKFQTGALKTGRTIDIIDSFNFSATTLTSNGAFIRSAISLESS